MDRKTIGAVHLVGGLVAGWFGWQAQDWGVLTIALVMVVVSLHHFGKKPR